MHIIISDENIGLSQLLKLSKDDLMDLGLPELNAKYLMKSLSQKYNIHSDAIHQRDRSSVNNENLSYADVIKSKIKCDGPANFSSSSSMKLVTMTSPVHGEVNTTAECIQQKEKQSISAETFLRDLGLEIRCSPGERATL